MRESARRRIKETGHCRAAGQWRGWSEERQDNNQPLIWGAAVMFMLSDMVLAVETFVLPPAHRARRLTAPTVWVLYWGAQALFFAVLIL